MSQDLNLNDMMNLLPEVGNKDLSVCIPEANDILQH